MTDLAIEYESVEALLPYVANSRTHSDAQVAQIAASIKEFGWTNPILIDGENTIIAGHGRLLAARKLKMDDVPVIRLDHLTKAQQRALVIADNKLALNADWDMELLEAELRALDDEKFNLALLGFDETELGNIMLEVSFEPGTEDDQGKLDQLDPKMVICPKCQHEFDSREAAA